MKYGLPYKGSKNKLAERIVRFLPQRTTLVDLFCGGCAVSHAALVMGKFPHVHINDINWMCPQLFEDALAGKFENETRWISREDFQRLKDTDPYVAFVWSFGNNLRDYLYSRDIEPLKRAIHYAMFYGDYGPARELGYDFSFCANYDSPQLRYAAIKQLFRRQTSEITPPNSASVRRESCRPPHTSDLTKWNLPRECSGLRRSLKKKKSLRAPLRHTARHQPTGDCIACSTANVTPHCRRQRKLPPRF